MVDNDDYDGIWSLRHNHDLFTVFVALKRRAWRQDKPRSVQERYYRFTLWKNQLILNTRSIALQTGIAESTLRDNLKKLALIEAIRIDEPVPRIKVVTILLAYDYGPNGERTPCSFRAPSVVDLRTGREYSVCDPLLDSDISKSGNNLGQPDTDILRDCRLEDSKNQSKLVRRESARDTVETDESCGIDDVDSPSDAEINMQITEICRENPQLRPEHLGEWAKSNQPILGCLK